MQNKIENVDMVAAILTSSIVKNIQPKQTPMHDYDTRDIESKAIAIFNNIKTQLDK